MGLSFRVRDGTGRFPHAMAAVTLSPSGAGRASGRGPGGGKSGHSRIAVDSVVRFLANGLLVGSRIVDAVFCVPTGFPTGVGGGVWCKLSAY